MHYGNWIAEDLVKEKPAVTLHPVGPILDPRVHYYLALTDPDAPTPLEPKNAEFAHWLLTNVTQTCHCNCKEESASVPKVTFPGPGIDIVGNDLLDYYPPAPGADTAPHRYVFVLLRPKDLAANPKLPKPNGRRHWGDTGKRYYGVRDYADANGLEPVGEFVVIMLILPRSYTNVEFRSQCLLRREQERCTRWWWRRWRWMSLPSRTSNRTVSLFEQNYQQRSLFVLDTL